MNMGKAQWNLRLPDDWLVVIEQVATKQGMTKAEFIRRCVLQNIPARSRSHLSEVKRGRPFKETNNDLYSKNFDGASGAFAFFA
jgi:hypothetical protein